MAKIGLIGVGSWGLNHLRSLLEIECNLLGISDVDPQKKSLADNEGIEFFEDYKQLIRKVDAVIVTTPTDTHYQIVSNCLNAGKHVLVEKPIAASSEQSKKLVELAKSKNLLLSVGYLYRFNNAIARTKELIRDVGGIQYITGRYIHSTKPPRTDSGVILNLGIHVIDILNFILEEIPRSLYANKKNLLSNMYEDSASVLITYKDFFASVELSCTHPEKARDLWIIAEKEKIYVDYFNQRIVRYPLTVTYEKVERAAPLEEDIPKNEPLKDELHYFVDLVDEKEIDSETNKGKENYYTTRICELCLKSAEGETEMVVE
jgi:UDP-N-acetylglucosamine 3-dehydrogenase